MPADCNRFASAAYVADTPTPQATPESEAGGGIGMRELAQGTRSGRSGIGHRLHLAEHFAVVGAVSGRASRCGQWCTVDSESEIGVGMASSSCCCPPLG